MLKHLFSSNFGEHNSIGISIREEIFNIFNKSGNKEIDLNEFGLCFENWIKIIVRPISAVIIVHSKEIIEPIKSVSESNAVKLTENLRSEKSDSYIFKSIAKLLTKIPFDVICYCLDANVTTRYDLKSNMKNSTTWEKAAEKTKKLIFDRQIKNIKYEKWPNTNVNQETIRVDAENSAQSTFYSECYDNYKVISNREMNKLYRHPCGKIFMAGSEQNKFEYTNLVDYLKSSGVTDIYLSGVFENPEQKDLLDYFINLGYRTVLIGDLAKFTNTTFLDESKEAITRANGMIVDSTDIMPLVQGQYRPLMLGYQLALKYD